MFSNFFLDKIDKRDRIILTDVSKRDISMANSIQFESTYSLNLEIVAGCTAMPEHPDFWRADVSVERLEKAAAHHGAFVFVFLKDRVTHAFGISACELLAACRECGVSVNSGGTPRYQLYIAYGTGEVFKSASRNNFVVKLYSNS